MPLYEYQCEVCGTRFEVIQKFFGPAGRRVPECGGPVHKLMSSPAIQFKGTGWYITDYAKKRTAASPPRRRLDVRAARATDAQERDEDERRATRRATTKSDAKSGSDVRLRPRRPARELVEQRVERRQHGQEGLRTSTQLQDESLFVPPRLRVSALSVALSL